MKKLTLKNKIQKVNSFIFSCIKNAESEEEFISCASAEISDLAIDFYDKIGEIFNALDFNISVTREGDVNCRFDATLIDSQFSIPIEIKSPREYMEINIKAIRQAFENKIVLLSREFYSTTPETTSLAIAFTYPPSRSDVYELIMDIKNAFNINIGIIDVADLLYMVYEYKVNDRDINTDYLFNFFGKFDREKAFH